MNIDLHFSSASNEWATPMALFNKLNAEYGPFMLDVCATVANHKCPQFFTLERGQDGLTASWTSIGPSPKIWMNPIYSQPESACKKPCTKKRCLKRARHNGQYVPGQIDWVKKAVKEAARGATVVCLLPARTDTAIFHKYCLKYAAEILFIEGRVTFNEDFGETDPAPFPSMIVIFKPNAGQVKVGSYVR